MARRYMSRHHARRRKTFQRKRSTKPSLKRQVTKTTRKVNKMERELYAWRQFQVQDNGVVSTNVHTDMITAPGSWENIFQSHDITNQEIPRQYMTKNIRFKYMIQTENNDVGNVWFQFFIVSLKPKFARQVRDRTNNLASLTSNVDYIAAPAGTVTATEGFCNFILNPAYYTVKHTSGTQRIGQSTMGADTPVTNIRDSTYFRSGVIPWKRNYKVGEHEVGGFLSLASDEVSNQNSLYAILLSNAGAGLGDIYISMNYQIMGQTVAGR